MPRKLHRQVFSEELLPDVAGFECGDAPWARDLADWISTPDGALQDMKDSDLFCRVYLWRDATGDVVGFGSLGNAEFRVPNPNKSPWRPVTIIPALAVDRRHQRQGHARRILEELLDLALEQVAQREYVVLLVHVDNAAARALYERVGFRELGKPFTEKETGWPHQKMFYDLTKRPQP